MESDEQIGDENKGEKENGVFVLIQERNGRSVLE